MGVGRCKERFLDKISTVVTESESIGNMGRRTGQAAPGRPKLRKDQLGNSDKIDAAMQETD